MNVWNESPSAGVATQRMSGSEDMPEHESEATQ
jgi:hypothetical protein